MKKESNNEVYYGISKLNNITQIIIPHFEKYPLITKKQNDLIIIKNIVKLINKGDHKKKNL